jgi:hypothetical protein
MRADFPVLLALLCLRPTKHRANSCSHGRGGDPMFNRSSIQPKGLKGFWFPTLPSLRPADVSGPAPSTLKLPPIAAAFGADDISWATLLPSAGAMGRDRQPVYKRARLREPVQGCAPGRALTPRAPLPKNQPEGNFDFAGRDQGSDATPTES